MRFKILGRTVTVSTTGAHPKSPDLPAVTVKISPKPSRVLKARILSYMSREGFVDEIIKLNTEQKKKNESKKSQAD